VRPPDFREPVIGDADDALRERLTTLWETAPGLKGMLTTVDHKQIGIRYIVTAFVFLLLGGIEALILRLQLAGPNLGLLTPEQYNELFSTHGMTMIFLYAGPILSGFSNYRYGFPPAQCARLLDLSGRRPLPLCRLPDRRGAERRLVQLRTLRRARL
jgi:hypothetical protein